MVSFKRMGRAKRQREACSERCSEREREGAQERRSARERGGEREREYDVCKKRQGKKKAQRKEKKKKKNPFLNVAEHNGRQRVSDAYCTCCYQLLSICRRERDRVI